MSTRAWIAGLIALMINAVFFGAGVIAVLSIPALADNAAILIPAVIVAAFVLTPGIAWVIAPRLRARYWAAKGMRPRAAFD